jgi:hypothetical protein
MHMISINIVSVLLAAAAAFIIGFLFHGPLLGKARMRLANIHPTGNEKMSDMVPQMLGNFAVNFVTALALSVIYQFVATSTLSSGPGLATGFLTAGIVWFGFLSASTLIGVIWMGQSFKLWLFEFFSSFVVMMVMAIIIVH